MSIEDLASGPKSGQARVKGANRRIFIKLDDKRDSK